MAAVEMDPAMVKQIQDGVFNRVQAELTSPLLAKIDSVSETVVKVSDSLCETAKVLAGLSGRVEESEKAVTERFNSQDSKLDAVLSQLKGVSSSGRGGGGGGPRRCYRCSSTKHLVANCPEPDERKAKDGEQEPCAMACVSPPLECLVASDDLELDDFHDCNEALEGVKVVGGRDECPVVEREVGPMVVGDFPACTPDCPTSTSQCLESLDLQPLVQANNQEGDPSVRGKSLAFRLEPSALERVKGSLIALPMVLVMLAMVALVTGIVAHSMTHGWLGWPSPERVSVAKMGVLRPSVMASMVAKGSWLSPDMRASSGGVPALDPGYRERRGVPLSGMTPMTSRPRLRSETWR